MKISGFTLIKNGVRFGFPFIESLHSLLELTDETIVNVGQSDDGTLDQIRKLERERGDSQLVIVESNWEGSKNALRGETLSEQTNRALERCTHDWCIYLQADEVLHESDLKQIRSALQAAEAKPEVDGLIFDFLHFYGSYGIIQRSRSTYRREIRAIRKSSGTRSVGDAQSFLKPGGKKLQVWHSGASVFHYGWVRPPEVMREKTFHMDKLYHGEPTQAESLSGQPRTGDNYRYKRIWGLSRFHGSHPEVMKKRIAEISWHWDPFEWPLSWSWSDAKKVALDLFERITNRRPFEFRNYYLLTVNPPPPLATVIVTTYEMPRELSLVCAGLERQSTHRFEVIICDDGSGQETRNVIEAFKRQAPFPVLHLWQENQGFRKCRILNEALRHAKGETLIFLDGDCIPHCHFVRDHQTQQERGRYLAGRRVDLGKKLSEGLSPEMVRSGFFDWPQLSVLWSILRGETPHFQRTFRVPWHWLRVLFKMTRVDDMKGCNYSLSREALFCINGFDESYVGYGREDTDVELRLKNLGLRIKSMKGLALQFHLWHPRREFTASNEDRLKELEHSGRIKCDFGLIPPQDM